MAAPEENAYNILTFIQGFDSFSLGPSSSAEEIARAFQTQSLIWHPDKNPGDAQAQRIYERMERAYNALIDPELRRKHDAALSSSNGGGSSNGHHTQQQPQQHQQQSQQQQPRRAVAATPQQNGHSAQLQAHMPPEDLGAPPPTARPFAYVDKDPGSATPAGQAGLRRGDAILRIGDASQLREVQGQLHASLNQPLAFLVIDVYGRFLKKWVVPRSWDSFAPASLLGCQMSDQCPLDLVSTHPVELAERDRYNNAKRLAARGGRLQNDDEEDGMGGGGHGGGNGNGRGGGGPGGTSQQQFGKAGSGSGAASMMARRAHHEPPASHACWPRVLLFLTSVATMGLGGTIVVYPAFSYQIFNVWELTHLNCRDVISEILINAVPPSAPPVARRRRAATAATAILSGDDDDDSWDPDPFFQQQQQQQQQQPQPTQKQQQQQKQWPQRQRRRAAAADDSSGANLTFAKATTTFSGMPAAPPSPPNMPPHSLPPAPPRSDAAPPPRNPSPAPPPYSPPQGLIRLLPPAPPPSPSTPPESPEMQRVPATTGPTGPINKGGDSVLPSIQHSSSSSASDGAGGSSGGGSGGSGSSGGGGGPEGTFIKLALATNFGVDLIRGLVSYLINASIVMIVIAFVGLALALCPPSTTRGLLVALYLSLGLPSWVFLVFVSVSALALQDDAEMLVTRYWECLESFSPSGKSIIPESARHVGVAASICVAAACLLLVGLLAACRVVGWRGLARHAVMAISMVSGLVGAATLAVGVVLKTTSNVDHRFFDGSVMGLGGCVFLVSLVGIVGSKRESRCLLRFYALSIAALIVALFGVSIYLVTDGTQALQTWLESNWDPIYEHICTSAISLCRENRVTRDEFERRASAHLLEITTLIVLLLLVLLVDLMMACVLQFLVAKYGREDDHELELASLVDKEEDDDDDEE